MSVLAIDIGSSSTKAVLYDWDGRLLGTESRLTPHQSHEPGEHAYPVAEVHAAVEGLVAGLCAAHPETRVDTLAFSCLGTAMAPLDQDDQPLGPALAPSDARPAASSLGRLGIAHEELSRRTGSDPGVGSFLLHALWWAEAHPRILERTHRFRSLRGYSLARLCGADAEDRSWASRTMLMDLGSGAWDPAILTAAGLPASLLPPIEPSTATYPLLPEAEARLGLAEGARVVIGAMDNCCSYLGACGVGRSGLVDIVGTYEHMAGVASLGVVRELAGRTGAMIHAYLLPDQFIALTRVPMGELLGRVAGPDPDGLEALLDEVSTQPMGRIVALEAQAIEAALASGRTRRDVVQSLLEASAAILARFADAWAALGMAAEPVAVVGGGARHHGLLQLKSTVLGRSLVSLEAHDSALLGALRLAAIAVRGATVGEACRRFDNPIASTIFPDAGERARRAKGVAAS